MHRTPPVRHRHIPQRQLRQKKRLHNQCHQYNLAKMYPHQALVASIIQNPSQRQSRVHHKYRPPLPKSRKLEKLPHLPRSIR
ncbi:hypothetical protein NFHSH190041_17570 [Shewanella sp. NFH-SH190041]|nr:hypothetical protein NFHSH190041_17570 [Shewanella sp. NFH-SH190041]